MDKKDKHIVDDIFRKKMSGYLPSDPGGVNEWSTIHVQLDKTRFYRFSFKTFNIYYAVTIGICVMVSGYLLTKKITSSNSTPEQGVTIPTDTLHLDHNDHTSAPSLERNVRRKKNIPYPTTSVNEETSDELLAIEYPNPFTAIDSSALATPTLPLEVPKKEEVEVLYLYIRDTIFQYDTVSVKKRKRKP
ncbi:MAG: hypothetical protein JWO58_580 [Chitinophagaceae bacterium]|nr:hypothetical protein [Chitinophagaceae bacterium]